MTPSSRRPKWLAALAALTAILLVAGIASAKVQPNQAELDEDLVSQLESSGAADRLMVFVHGTDIEDATRAVRATDMQLVDAFEKVGVAVATGSPAQILDVGRRPGVTFVQADQAIEFLMSTSHIATRGQEAIDGFSYTTTQQATNKKGKAKKNQTATTTRQFPGVDGSGVSIAVVDSGVDGTHPMFQVDGKSKVLKNYKLVCASGVIIPTSGPCTGPLGDPSGSPGDAIDEAFVDMTAVNDTDTPSAGGHGTHVAAITAGVDSESPEGTIHGAAPGAKIISLSVGAALSVYGGSAGLNWVLEHHNAPCGEAVDASVCPPIKVVNNSWGSGGDYNSKDLRSKIQDALVAEGVTVVWAAGNDGGNGSEDAVNPPAKSPTPGVISVANYDDGNTGTRDGGLNSTSSRGMAGKTGTYPDVSAPGTNIISACRPYLAICTSAEEDPNYGTIGGTSMAAPHVAGIVAQLVQAGRRELGRDLSPAELEDALEDTAYQFAGGGLYETDVGRNSDHTTSFDKGHGLVDVVAAISDLLGLKGVAGLATSCDPTNTVVLDEAGDATDLVVATPLPSEPQLDVTEGQIEWDPATGTVTFKIKVADLQPADPQASTGLFFDYDFSYAGGGYYVDAIREGTNQEFLLGRLQTTRETLVTGLQGSFDPESDTITIKLTNEDLAKTTVVNLPPFSDGSVLSGFTITSRRELGNFVPNTDTATGSCPYTLGLGAVPPPQVESPSLSTTPPATINGGSEFTWEGAPRTNSGDLFGCEAVTAETPCEQNQVTIVVPEAGTTLDVSIEVDLEEANDFDLYIYRQDGVDADGNPVWVEIARSANIGGAEGVAVPIAASGEYLIEVVSYLTVEASYRGTAKVG